MVVGQNLEEKKAAITTKMHQITIWCDEFRTKYQLLYDSSNKLDLLLFDDLIPHGIIFAKELSSFVSNAYVNVETAIFQLEAFHNKDMRILINHMAENDVENFKNLLRECSKFYHEMFLLIHRMIQFDLFMTNHFQMLKSNSQKMNALLLKFMFRIICRIYNNMVRNSVMYQMISRIFFFIGKTLNRRQQLYSEIVSVVYPNDDITSKIQSIRIRVHNEERAVYAAADTALARKSYDALITENTILQPNDTNFVYILRVFINKEFIEFERFFNNASSNVSSGQ